MKFGMKVLSVLVVFGMSMQLAQAGDCDANALVESHLAKQGFRPVTSSVFSKMLKKAKRLQNTAAISSENKHVYSYRLLGSGGGRTVKRTQDYGYALQTGTARGDVSMELSCVYSKLYWPGTFGDFDSDYPNEIDWKFTVGGLIDLENSEIVPGYAVRVSLATKGDLEPGRESEFRIETDPNVISDEEGREIISEWKKRLQKLEPDFEELDSCQVSRKHFSKRNEIAVKTDFVCEISGGGSGISLSGMVFHTYKLQ
jgi:hypothetical protein